MDPGSFIANFTPYCYEFKYTSSLYRRALALRNSFRLIDDISNLNSDGVFQELACKIYPSSLILYKENDDDN